MKVNLTTPNLPRPQQLAKKAEAGSSTQSGRESPSSIASGSEDTVSLGRREQLVALAMSGPEPADRQARIAELSSLVARGRFEPDSTRVSDALIQDALNRAQ